jgi:hypothetical protein
LATESIVPSCEVSDIQERARLTKLGDRDVPDGFEIATDLRAGMACAAAGTRDRRPMDAVGKIPT